MPPPHPRPTMPAIDAAPPPPQTRTPPSPTYPTAMAELQDDHRPEGYDPDSRAGAGAEPVGIEIRRSRAGLGAEEPVLAPTPVLAPVEKPREVSERERRQQEEMAAELREDSRNGLPEHLVRLGRPDLVAEQHHAALDVGERIHGRDEVRHGLLHVDHVCSDDEIEAARGG